MTPEQIIEMAKQSGFDAYDDLEEGTGRFSALQSFAQLARNAALEEAAIQAEYENAAEWSISGQIARQIRSLKS